MRTVSRSVYAATLFAKCCQAKDIARRGKAGTMSREYAEVHRDIDRLLTKLADEDARETADRMA